MHLRKYRHCRYHEARVETEVIGNVAVRGDGGANAVHVLLRDHPVDEREHEHAAAQGMRPERHRGTGSVRVVGVPARDHRAARRVEHQRVEAHDPGAAVTGVHHVRGPVERQSWPPAPAADVLARCRTDDLRRVQPALHRVLARFAHRHRDRAVAGCVRYRVATLFLHRHVRVPGRHHQRLQPDHAHRVRVRRPAAGRHPGRAVRRFPERQARVRRRVRPEPGSERDGPGPGPTVHLRHVRTVQDVLFNLQDHVRSENRHRELQDRVRQARQPQASHTVSDDRRLAVDRRSFYW